VHILPVLGQGIGEHPETGFPETAGHGCLQVDFGNGLLHGTGLFPNGNRTGKVFYAHRVKFHIRFQLLFFKKPFFSSTLFFQSG
jgi:hypothetical protein